MPNPVTDQDDFTDVTSPATGEDADQATFLAGIQALANRTRYLFNRLGAVVLAANRVLGRASTGPTEGKATTDFSFAQFALASAVAWFDKLTTQGAAIDSASVTNIAAATGISVHIAKDEDEIDTFGTAPAGVYRFVTFDADITLKHSASIELLGIDIVTKADDFAIFKSLGANVWRLVSYWPSADPGVTTAAASAAGVLTLDFSSGRVRQLVVLHENVTSVVFDAPPDRPGSIMLEIVQDGTGGWTLTGWPATTVWAGALKPTFGDGADERRIVSMYFNGESPAVYYSEFRPDVYSA